MRRNRKPSSMAILAVLLLLLGIIALDPLTCLILGTGLILLCLALMTVGGRSRPEVGMCPRCGYDLRGTRGRCPECGRLVPPGTPIKRFP